MADDTGLFQIERIHERQHVGCMLVGAERSSGLVAVAEAAQVRREQGVALGEPRHDRLPGQPVFRPAMQQQDGGPLAGARDMEGRAVGPNRQMLHRGCSLFS